MIPEGVALDRGSLDARWDGRAEAKFGLGTKAGITEECSRIIAAADPSSLGSFTTAPEKPRPFSFGVIGDTQFGHEAHQVVIGRLSKESIDFLLHVGDHVHVSSNYSEWLQFFSIEKSLLDHVPIYPAPPFPPLNR